MPVAETKWEEWGERAGNDGWYIEVQVYYQGGTEQAVKMG